MNGVFIPRKEDFESKINGKDTQLIKLENNGLQVYLTNYGARIVSILVPDKNGRLTDVNLGHSNIADYTKVKANYYGCVTGRVCGRIGGAKFTIGGKEYQLKPNLGNHLLHGGIDALHTKVFDVDKLTESKVEFSCFSADGEEGFPGNLQLKVSYELTALGELTIEYQAVSDQKTPFNITNHAYFNLNGEGNGDILNHKLQIFSDSFIPVDGEVLPTGEVASVKGTAFDFTQIKTIGRDIDADEIQLNYGGGYDHTFVLGNTLKSQPVLAAKAISDLSGIIMEAYTDQPGIHLYTGNAMDGSLPLKSGGFDHKRTAFCLETQHWTDAINQPNFPSIILQRDIKFTSKTIFKFYVE